MVRRSVVFFWTALAFVAPAMGEGSSWLWLLPGGGQYALGQTGKGHFYLSGTLGLLGWGLYAETERESGEVNAPLVYAQQLYLISFYSAYRDLRLLSWPSAERLDPASTAKLVTAPFQWEQLKSPWVIGPALVGVGAALAVARTDDDRRKFRELHRVRYLGATFKRDESVVAHTAYWIPLSLGAGVSEEMLFRGVLQANAEDRWGPGWGLTFASGLFGLAHIANRGNAADAIVPLIGGFYLGWRYQRMNYRLAQPIAAHTWYDIAVGVTLFLADPAENPLGAKVQFGF
jgi:membrane protease YdiL (CAAX protease family)